SLQSPSFNSLAAGQHGTTIVGVPDRLLSLKPALFGHSAIKSVDCLFVRVILIHVDQQWTAQVKEYSPCSLDILTLDSACCRPDLADKLLNLGSIGVDISRLLLDRSGRCINA